MVKGVNLDIHVFFACSHSQSTTVTTTTITTTVQHQFAMTPAGTAAVMY